MKIKKPSKKGIGIVLIEFMLVLVSLLSIYFITGKKETPSSQPIAIVPLNTEILAHGSVRSQNEVDLHFQTGGKLVYLPFKEGDSVQKGQTVASLDTYPIQKQLEVALNNYRSVRDSFDQAKDNSQNNILQSQQKAVIDASKAGIGGAYENTVINDMAKRILDQNQATLDNSVIQVQLANYAFSLSVLTSPIDGILIHQDASYPNTNITPQTSFVIEDPNTMIFKANVSEDDIAYILEGSAATITLTGKQEKQIPAIVTRILPEKKVLPTGENVYEVEITPNSISDLTQYNQDGVVLIDNKYSQPVVTVPSWLILNKQFIWVNHNGSILLKRVTIGDSVGNTTTVLDGLTDKDSIIDDPQIIARPHYTSL
jgi:multidrug efflux pump subunit AcrA (membrane-fusion protein)